ncbi:DUF2061 domain-containing protein [Kistimonas asteriae]|uniref:DUF2061 domain-containing protein n=1 Tax=Kistimonas asteriae TaxID=517724 RepID=UPI001BA900FE|nr:DUF2061 domain-containing protein [Kistimonas asteriae]
MTKTLTFAAIHFFIGFTIVYLLTGSLAIGGLVALIEPTCNTVAYFFHEKIWNYFRLKRAKNTRTGFYPTAMQAQ